MFQQWGSCHEKQINSLPVFDSLTSSEIPNQILKKNRLDYEIDFALLIWLHIGTCLDISLNGTNQDLKRNLSRIKIKMMSSFTLMKLFLLATKYLLRKQIMFVSFSFIFVARFSVFFVILNFSYLFKSWYLFIYDYCWKGCVKK